MPSTLKIVLAAAVVFALPALAGAADGQALWTKHCATCHGADGAGQTPMGTKLKVKNYTDPAVQAEMTDEIVLKSIAEGRKNEAGKLVMPSFAAKIPEEDRPAVLAHLRTLAKQP
jgi:cytochrome c6